jgi:hypothetical protein
VLEGIAERYKAHLQSQPPDRRKPEPEGHEAASLCVYGPLRRGLYLPRKEVVEQLWSHRVKPHEGEAVLWHAVGSAAF